MNAVWLDKSAVGRITVSDHRAEITGSAMVSEHFPRHDISWTVNTLFIIKNPLQKTQVCHKILNINTNRISKIPTQVIMSAKEKPRSDSILRPLSVKIRLRAEYSLV